MVIILGTSKLLSSMQTNSSSWWLALQRIEIKINMFHCYLLSNSFWILLFCQSSKSNNDWSEKEIIKFVSVKPLSTNLCIFENKYFAKSTQINVHENQWNHCRSYYYYYALHSWSLMQYTYFWLQQLNCTCKLSYNGVLSIKSQHFKMFFIMLSL